MKNKEDKSIARTECEICGNPIYVIDEINENAQDAVNHFRFVCSTPCLEMYQDFKK